MSTAFAFDITRVVDAPRDKVWQAWTEPERLRKWWGPKGFACTHCTVDLRPGGLMHYCLRAPDGMEMWGRFIYREVVKPSKLVFVVAFSDAKGRITGHPMSPDWPQQMLSTVAFEAQGQKTKIIVRWQAIEATDLERKTFEDGAPSMQQGWTGTFEQLEAYFSTNEAQ
jgi:uncharacterized protein YndB with AHSA1/START domain